MCTVPEVVARDIQVPTFGGQLFCFVLCFPRQKLQMCDNVYLFSGSMMLCNFVTNPFSERICWLVIIRNVCTVPEVVARDIQVPRFRVFALLFVLCSSWL